MCILQAVIRKSIICMTHACICMYPCVNLRESREFDMHVCIYVCMYNVDTETRGPIVCDTHILTHTPTHACTHVSMSVYVSPYMKAGNLDAIAAKSHHSQAREPHDTLWRCIRLMCMYVYMFIRLIWECMCVCMHNQPRELHHTLWRCIRLMCMYVCVCVYATPDVYVCVYAWFVCVHVCKCAHSQMRENHITLSGIAHAWWVCMYACVCVCIYLEAQHSHVCICAYICVNQHIQ
jgi:hypothetical protein